jgi:hypothetical protein
VAQWLRYCATNRKFAGSIPDGVTGIFLGHLLVLLYSHSTVHCESLCVGREPILHPQPFLPADIISCQKKSLPVKLYLVTYFKYKHIHALEDRTAICIWMSRNIMS